MINTIYLNGKKTQVDLEKSNLLIDIVEKYSRKIKSQNIAVAVNMKIVTRSEWKSFKVEKNDKIEIVSPFPEVKKMNKKDYFEIDGKKFNSRLIMGTSFILINQF